MLSEEEIEKAKLYKSEYMQIPVTMLTKENLDKLEEHCKKTIRIERGVEHSVVLELLYKYRELEVDKQKLIEKLKENNERDTESVKRYEEMRRNCNDEFYKNSYQTSIHKLNAKREVRKEILEILKGEN